MDAAPEIVQGRPTSYNPDYPRQAYNLCLLGATNQALADHFQVSLATIDTVWRNRYPKFLGALLKGRAEADAKVAKSMYRRALGYKHKAVKIAIDTKTGAIIEAPYIEHYPPDTPAGMFWLKNRQPHMWKDRSQVDVKHGLDESLSGLIAAAFTGATIEGAARVVELPAVSVEYTIEVNEAESLEVVSPETRAETNGDGP